MTVPGPTDIVGTTTEVDITYTTTCPVTETVTAPGTTYTTTFTTTSVCFTKVLTTLFATATAPPVVQTTEVVQYETITSLCPVTETKTIGGSTVVITWTSTSLIQTVVPTTVNVFTTQVTTEVGLLDSSLSCSYPLPVRRLLCRDSLLTCAPAFCSMPPPMCS